MYQGEPLCLIGSIAMASLQSEGRARGFWYGDHRSRAEGVSIEVPQAPRGCEALGWGVPLPNGIFLTSLLGMVHFGVYSDTISQFPRSDSSRLKEKQNPAIK